MAPAGPFDLTEAIGRWRAAAAQQPAMNADALDELEAHLRDGVERLEAAGLTTEEAFRVASRRLGAPEAVGQEFARLNPQAVWLDRALWMLLGVILWGPVSGLFMAASIGVAWQTGDGRFPPAIAVIAAQGLALALSLGLCVWLVAEKGPRFVDLLGPRLARPWSLVGVGFALTLCVLLILVTSRVLFVWGWFGVTAPVFNSALPVQVFQVVLVVMALLFLMRRRWALVHG